MLYKHNDICAYIRYVAKYYFIFAKKKMKEICQICKDKSTSRNVGT